MRAIVPPKRSDGRSSFRTLRDYLTRLDNERTIEHVPGFDPERERVIDTQFADLGRVGTEPPPEGRHRLRDLSELRVVQFAERGAVLLPRDVSRDVEHREAERDYSLRWTRNRLSGDWVDPDTGEVRQDDVFTETNCLSLKTASAEMKAVADMNGRVKDPVYHAIVSWRSDEKPTDDQMFGAGRAAMKAVGMEGHQYVMAAHRDTDNWHVHIMVNRVNPETERAVYPDRDFYKLDRCMREVELEQGWAHDTGTYAVKEIDGRKVVDWAEDRDALNTAEKAPRGAQGIEGRAGMESLFTYAREQARADVLDVLKQEAPTWQELHSVLAKHGLELREKGQGFGIYAREDAGVTPIKASDLHESLGRGRLEKRLGKYEAPIRAVTQREPEQRYSKHREVERGGRDNNARDQAREQRAQQRAALREQFKTYQAQTRRSNAQRRSGQSIESKQRFKALATEQRARREELMRGAKGPEERKALQSVLAMQTVKEREALRAELAEQRRAQRQPPQVWREWVADRAQEGDAAALSALRGLEYADKRKARAAELAEQAREREGHAGIVSQQRTRQEPHPPQRLTERMSWEVDRRNGDVTYRLDGRDAFTDHGRQLMFSKGSEQERDAVAAGLMLARQKFGPELTVTGSVEFKKLAVETAVARGMDVRFADQSLEAYRRELVKQREREQERSSRQSRGKDFDPPSRGR